MDVIVVEFNLLVKADFGDYHTKGLRRLDVRKPRIQRFPHPAVWHFNIMDIQHEDVRSRIETVLDTVRRSLAQHRGGIEFVDFDTASGCVSLRFTGACAGCPMANETLKCIVEDAMACVPEVHDVVAVNVDSYAHED